MCGRNYILHWCPCEIHAMDTSLGAPEASQRHFDADAEGHTIVKRTFTQSYTWCDEYFIQPTFIKTFFMKPPPCPKGLGKDNFLHFRSKELCKFCRTFGCPAPDLSRPCRTTSIFKYERRQAKKAGRRFRRASEHSTTLAIPARPVLARRIPLLAHKPLRTIDLKALDKCEAERLKVDAVLKAKSEARKANKTSGSKPAEEDDDTEPQLTKEERWRERIRKLQAGLDSLRKERAAAITTTPENTAGGNGEAHPAEGAPRHSEEDDTTSIRPAIFNPRG